VSSQWILVLLSADSLTDSLAEFAGFSRWISSLDSLAGFARWIRSLDSLASLAGVAHCSRWIRSLLTLDPPGEFSLDSPADESIGTIRNRDDSTVNGEYGAFRGDDDI
jgi:hypothetical protein